MDELIRLEHAKPQELRLEALQGISLVLKLLKSLKSASEEREWVDTIVERLRNVEKEDGLKLKARIQRHSELTKERLMRKSLYESNEVKYENIIRSELERIEENALSGHTKDVNSVCVMC